jgi:hypothetical protein
MDKLHCEECRGIIDADRYRYDVVEYASKVTDSAPDGTTRLIIKSAAIFCRDSCLGLWLSKRPDDDR